MGHNYTTQYNPSFNGSGLKGTANLNVIKDPEKSFETIQLGREYPREILMNFLELYKGIKSKNRMMQNPIPGSKEIDGTIEILNDFRNNFFHFIPYNWSLEIAWHR
jgi:hypothetical protein